jgi:bacterioferritin-associated ferredoxin
MLLRYIRSYARYSPIGTEHQDHTSMYVCLCNRITDRQVRTQAAGGNCTLGSVHNSLGISPKCGKCLPMMRDIVREHKGQAGGASNV